jgi:hypothetical protein
VHHYVGDSGRGVVFGHCVCQLGIQDGEARPVKVCVQPAFFPGFRVGKHCRGARFAARRGNRQHHAHRQRPDDCFRAFPEFPDIRAGIFRSVRDSFGCVNRAPAADRQHKIRAGIQGGFYAVPRMGEQGIGLNPAEQHILNIFSPERVLYFIQKPRFYDASSAVYYYCLCSPVFFYELPRFIFLVFSENDFGGHMVRKRLHIENPFRAFYAL